MDIEPMNIELIPTAVDSEVCECGSWEHTSDLAVIRHDIWELKQTVNKLIELVASINEQVEPALDAVAKSPLGMVLGLDKK